MEFFLLDYIRIIDDNVYNPQTNYGTEKHWVQFTDMTVYFSVSNFVWRVLILSTMDNIIIISK